MSGALRNFMTQLKSKDFRRYLRSTHFWGPFMNWSIPIATILDTRKNPRFISGKMTVALSLYSMVFMRFAWKVNPRNLLLLACHFTNASVQIIQGTRFVNYYYIKGPEAYDREQERKSIIVKRK